MIHHPLKSQRVRAAQREANRRGLCAQCRREKGVPTCPGCRGRMTAKQRDLNEHQPWRPGGPGRRPKYASKWFGSKRVRKVAA